MKQVQETLQRVDTDALRCSPDLLPATIYRDLRDNSRTLDESADALPNPDPEELKAIRDRGKAVRRWSKWAALERVIHCFVPAVPGIYACHLVWHYENLCVVSRTYCEAKAPEFIDLFHRLV